MDINDDQLHSLIDSRIQDYLKSGAFTDRKITDTPTDALQAANKKYVDSFHKSAKIYLSGSQTLTKHALPYDKVLFDATDFNNNMTVDLTNHRITVPDKGYYVIMTQLTEGNSIDNDLLIPAIAINGSQVGYTPVTAAGTQNFAAVCSDVYSLNANDYIEVNGYGGQALNFGTHQTFLAVYKI